MACSNIFSCLTFFLLSTSLVFAYAIDYEYGPKPENKPKEKQVEENQPNYDEEETKPKRDQEYHHHNIPTNSPDHEYHYGHDHHDQYANNIGIRGLIFCQRGPDQLLPLPGAVARITCLAEDENGYEAAPFYTESHESNEDGFFFATLSLSEAIGSDKLKLKECKAFLEDSPLETCNVPTDHNNGISGAVLSSPRFLPEKLMTLYTVGPFIFSSDSNSVPANDHSIPDGHY